MGTLKVTTPTPATPSSFTLKNGIPSRLRPDQVLTSDCMEIMTSFTQRFAGLFWLLLSMESEVVRRFIKKLY